MIEINSVKIKEMLVEHLAWLRGEYSGNRADLSCSDLSCSDLSSANLSCSDLSRANLSSANLIGSNLSYAVLRSANLSYANLSSANLSGADLSGANLSYAVLHGARLPESIYGCVCRMDFGGWSICIYHDHTVIGCRRKPNESWLKWTPESPEIIAMHSGAAEWWQVHGEAIKAAIRCVMAKAAKYQTEKERVE